MIIYDKDGNILLDIEVDDTSVRYKAINGENSLTLKFSLEEHVELPLGSYCIFKNERYILMLPEDLTMKHRRNFEYAVLMHSEDARSKRYKFINPIDGRLKFSLTAKPSEHLQMFVDNMNIRDAGWSIRECPEQAEIVLSYNHTYCYDALVQLANELGLDFWFDGKEVSLGKLERNKENPLSLSYGGDGKGLKANVKRNNYTEALPLEVLYVQGTSVNIDPSKYRVTEDRKRGSSELLLPPSQTIGYDGTFFDTEVGFDSSKARYYKTDSDGYSISRADKEVMNHSEDSLDCTEIEPTKEETVLSVVEVNVDEHYYDIVFESPVDYKNYGIEGEKAYVVFQKGMLAGKEFDLATDNSGNLICKDEDGKWRVEIQPQEIDGITMPDKESGFLPVEGDTFKVFGIQLPEEYISDPNTKTGAEWEMFKYAVKHFFLNEDVQYTISGELDEIYAKNDWENIEGRITLGSYVSFTDKSFQPEPLLIRITGIKEYVNKPRSPFLEISNASMSAGLIGSLNRMENQEAYTEKIVDDSRRFTKRRFADALRSIKMLEKAFGDNFSESISPATVRTMMMLVGDETLQFAFVETIGSDEVVPHQEYFDLETKTFKCDAGILKHYTLDVTEIRSKFDQKYHYWSIPAYESAVLDDAEKEYYVYAVVNADGEDGDFRLEPDPLDLRIVDEEGKDKYCLLLGLLLKEYEGSRDFMPLYGFTQILPGQITTDVIRSADGDTYFDLANNEIGGVVKFKAGSSGLENIEGYLNIGNQNMLRNSGFTGDYLSEPLADQTVMDASKKLYSDPLDHWKGSQGVTVVEEADSQSGYAVRVNADGVLTQELYSKAIKDESYIVSFKAKGKGTLQVSLHDTTMVEVDSENGYTRYEAKISPAQTYYVFSVLAYSEMLICEIQLERGTIATAWGMSPLDNSSDRTYYQALKYLSQALAGSTTTAGGLILTNLIQLGDQSNQSEFRERAGANGLYFNDDDTPAFWGGGTLEQAIATVARYKDDPTYQPTEAELADMAHFVVTHGGRAILNEGIFRGTVYAQNGVFGGRLQLVFQEVNGQHTLSLSDSSSIWIKANMEDAVLTLPENAKFDGWQLNVFAYPIISKNDGQPYIRGKILCPHKTTDKLYYASQIYLPNGGYMQFTYRDGWVLINDQTSEAEYTEHTN